MTSRTAPLELAKRAAPSVAEWDRAETDRIRRAWDETFARSVIERIGKRVYRGYRWHAFSWGFTRAESQARATELYVAEQSAEWIVLPEREDRLAFTFNGCPPLDFGECGHDLYVIPATLDWTMAFTHEQPSIGPFFSKRGWCEAEPRDDRWSVLMNCRYFACADHREHVDAGYRWAYWTLEEKSVVELDQDIDMERLLAADEYWNPPTEEQNPWLCVDVLPTARAFLQEHAGHRLVYVEEDYFTAGAEHDLKWREAD